MARFIELPYGEYNQETKKTERTTMMANLDQIITIKPQGEFACAVKMKGATSIVAYRRYDTLRAQVTNRQDLMETYPDEEVSAAYEQGYEKGKKEAMKCATRSQIIKATIKQAVMWFEENPMANGWQGKFRRDLTAILQNDDLDSEEDDQPATENEF